jgi:hypothetical protein
MSEPNGTGSQQNNTGGYSAEYVKELREEAATWRTKFRDAESTVASMNEKVASLEKSFTLKGELDKRGLKVDPSWVKLEKDQTPAQAVEKFLENYPQFKTDSQTGDGQPPSPTPRPQPPQKRETNAPSFQNADYESIKKDPIARSKLRDMYRSMLSQGNMTI